MTRLGEVLARHRVVVLLLLAGATVLAFPTRWDYRVLDAQFRLLRALREVPVTPDVTIVGIDDDTYAALREPFALWHPHFGALFAAMAELKPSVLAVDVTLPEHSYDAIVPGYDKALLMGLLQLKRARVPVVLGQAVTQQGMIRRLIAPAIAIAGEDSFAAIYLKPDAADGYLRRVGPFLVDQKSGAPIPVLSSKAAAVLGKTPREGLINYALGTPMSYVPLQQLLAWQASGELAQHAALFAGRPVFLGPIEPFTDRHPAAVNLGAGDIALKAQAETQGQRYSVRVPGVLVHAQIVRSYLADAVIRPLEHWSVLLPLHLAACAAWWLRGLWARLAFIVLFPAVLIGGATLALTANLFLPVVGVLAFATLALLGRLASDQFDLYRERQRLRSVFGAAVSPAVLKGILSGRIVPQQAGKDAELCILSADIRGYTRRCQSITPGEAVRLLNRYFTDMVEAIHRHDGTVDKFIGDGLLAFFGEPRVPGAPDPCAQALAAVAGMRERLAQINEELVSSGNDPLRIGVGLEFGHVVVGFVGSPRRREYTVIGDTVNTAARIESLSKKVFRATAPAFSVLCSNKVYERLDERARQLLQDYGAHALDGGREVRTYGYAA